MANTFQIIAQANLTSNAATITLDNLSQDYDTLYMYYSVKTTYNANQDYMLISTNVSTDYYRVGIASNNGISYQSAGTSTMLSCAGNSVANAFGTGELIINRYSSTTIAKQFGYQSGASGTTSTDQRLGAGRMNSTQAITSITFTPLNIASFVAGSNIYLYGVNTTV
jgi:hypothetical protein